MTVCPLIERLDRHHVLCKHKQQGKYKKWYHEPHKLALKHLGKRYGLLTYELPSKQESTDKYEHRHGDINQIGLIEYLVFFCIDCIRRVGEMHVSHAISMKENNDGNTQQPQHSDIVAVEFLFSGRNLLA